MFIKQIVIVLILLVSSAANATIVSYFSENFESGNLNQWTGKHGGAHSGVITTDPLVSSNHVLHFNKLGSAGDIFTLDKIQTTGTTFTVSFDYLGLCNNGVSTCNSGGFFGIDTGLPGAELWVAGTGSYPVLINLISDNSWHTYNLTFDYNWNHRNINPAHLKFEDYVGSDKIVGNAYFDNINFYDTSNPPPAFSEVPEPSVLALLGLGVLCLITFRRKVKSQI